MYKMYLILNFLVPRVMIRYLPMVLLPSIIFNLTAFCIHKMHDTMYDILIDTSGERAFSPGAFGALVPVAQSKLCNRD
jgi:hypothetical protein